MPLRVVPAGAQASGSVWNYHIKLAMPESNNFLVCQYKVLFDAQEQVKEDIWRRHQCLDIINETAPR
ncbi:hypothetical protein [Castellaniella sp.]|uniref:hypothetical protein n=1 Tax=Castellaniella sp. TaxID=1955812 RepID=UPI002AFE760D|nr:hypothetical protein [Castellaniella sp.]